MVPLLNGTLQPKLSLVGEAQVYGPRSAQGRTRFLRTFIHVACRAMVAPGAGELNHTGYLAMIVTVLPPSKLLQLGEARVYGPRSAQALIHVACRAIGAPGAGDSISMASWEMVPSSIVLDPLE